jgi:hypothetical protein
MDVVAILNICETVVCLKEVTQSYTPKAVIFSYFPIKTKLYNRNLFIKSFVSCLGRCLERGRFLLRIIADMIITDFLQKYHDVTPCYPCHRQVTMSCLIDFRLSLRRFS